MSDILSYLWQLPEKPKTAEELRPEPLGKAALPVTRSPWEQAEANAALATGDLAVVKEFARAHGGGVSGCDPEFIDRLEKAAADSNLDDDERGWLTKLFSKARTS
jgi:hypothetical protein